MALRGKRVQERMVDLKILVRPSMCRTEIFVRPDNSADWYHQGAVNPGHVGRTCHFGSVSTKPGSCAGHDHRRTCASPGGKPTRPLPKARTRADGLRVIRA